MGQSSSKVSGVKQYSPPEVTVSKDLRKSLEDDHETDVVRQLYSETYIEQQVAKRLYDERVYMEKQLEESQKAVPELSDARIKEFGTTDSRELRKKVADLHNELVSRPLRGQLDAQSKQARQKLVECLVSHRQQPLKCRETFAEFQKEVSRIEKEVAASA